MKGFEFRQPPATYRARLNRQRVIEMHGQGYTAQEIAQTVGVSLGLVREVVRPRPVPVVRPATVPPALAWQDYDAMPLGARSAA